METKPTTTGTTHAADAERTALLASLNHQRQHVLGILEGLDEAALRQPVLPSGWTCLGLVQHLACMERFWLRVVAVGDPVAEAELAAVAEEWQVPPHVSAAAVLDDYRTQIALADGVVAATPLDAPPANWPGDRFGEWRLHTLREVVLHVLVETACHAGHLDAARELLDGRQWFVLEA